MPAPNKNKNAQGHTPPNKGKLGVTTTISLDYESWEQLKAAVDTAEGHAFTEAEYKKTWRRLCNRAVGDYIKRWNPFEDAIII